MKNKNKNKNKKLIPLITVAEKNSAISEQYRTIRSNIQFTFLDKEFKTLVITSADPGDGKSTVAANLAVVFANSDKRVLLVDADLRLPKVSSIFKLSNKEGLSTLLKNRKEKLSKYIQKSGLTNLYILLSGPMPPNPSEVLSSDRMFEVIKILKKHFDLIIFDMPPVAAVTDAQVLSAKTDGTLLVVREHNTKKQSLAKAHELLKIANANVIGVIYNASTNNEESYYYN